MLTKWRRWHAGRRRAMWPWRSGMKWLMPRNRCGKAQQTPLHARRAHSMPDSPSETDPLIFHWQQPARKTRGLLFWLVAVLLALAGFFYLFQVVYPQAQRFTPVPHHIVALSPADPA